MGFLWLLALISITTQPEDTYHNWTMANHRMVAALDAKGYDYQHTFCEQAGHVDRRVVAQTLAGGLEWLWAGYETEEPGVIGKLLGSIKKMFG